MPITIGSQLGSHQITALLGRGGMGEVYRARDTKLKREVAIKILPEEFSRDADRVGRFQREAEALASLNHPNIAGIYEIAEADQTRFLVLELVEGETLADRIIRGPVPVEETLTIAKQICEALEAAHEKGIIHRDLKPANIKVAPDGKVKILDFGLAKMFGVGAAHPSMSNSPTVVGATGGGMIMGTAAYMSPEQARGKTVDRRSDIWSFGCVLYEMLTGTLPFQGETVTDILGSIVKTDPDWSTLPRDLPPAANVLLRRCLQKDLGRRLRDIGDARLELEEAMSASPKPIEPGLSKPRRMWRERIAWILAAIAIAIISVGSALYFNPSGSPETYLQVVTLSTPDAVSMAIAPDGRKLVFTGTVQGRPQLFFRSFDSPNQQPLPGTDGATYPFWSPDSRSIAFFAANKLKRIDLANGSVQVLANVAPGRGGAWSSRGVIIFTPTLASPLSRIPANGGPTTVMALKGSGHTYPVFLPDGRHFLFYTQGNADNRGVYWGDLDSSENERLFDSDSAAVYVPSGHLLFVRQGTLLAVRFDPAKRQLMGDPFTVVERITFDGGASVAAISVGGNTLAYRTGGASGARRLVWFDPTGKELLEVAANDTASPNNVDLSPDGRMVAQDRTVGANRDIWIREIDRQITRRLTFDANQDLSPIWSGDGSRIAFSSNRKGTYQLYVKSVEDADSEQLLVESSQTKVALDWSRDSRYIIYRETDSKNGADLWVVPLFGDRKHVPFLATEFDERDAQFSPDGHWVAYASNENETGQYQVYVLPFPGPGGKWQVSNTGGSQPRWRDDGKALFYVNAEGVMTSVQVETTPDGKSFKALPPVAMFPTHILEVTGGNRQQYAVSRDAKRFLINVPTETASVSPITVILNWNPVPKK